MLIIMMMIGTIEVEGNGNGVLVTSNPLSVKDIIGRSVVLKQILRNDNDDDDGSCKKGLAWGVIARAAGVGQNIKKVCPCDSPSF